jgi:predicted DsbA family dithiol-disulfide isomerase
MSAKSPVSVQYFSDVLCVWAYVGQARLDELETEFSDQVVTDAHFLTIFADARDRLSARWKDRGGLAGYAEHVRSVVARFDHCGLHADTWATVAPTSSLGCHIFLAAVKLYDREVFRRATWELRLAFFRDGVDVSRRDAQLGVAERICSTPAGPTRSSRAGSISPSTTRWT